MDDVIEIKLPANLNSDTVARIWQPYMDQQAQEPSVLTLQAQDVQYCGGAGIALIQELTERQEKMQNVCRLQNAPASLQKMLQLSQKKEHPIETLPEDHETHTKIRLPSLTKSIWQSARESITFLGMVCFYLFHALTHPSTIRWKDTWQAIEDVGPSALPIIMLIGFLVGLISAFQSAVPLGQFGAQIYIINLVGIGLVKEMGPLMTAVLLAGRTASSFAAEIGTMKINQEVDALTTMGLEPVRFLTISRILATTIMSPFLNMFLILFGLIGCSIVMRILGYNIHLYIHQLEHAVRLSDFLCGMLKATSFGAIIAIIGCLNGLKTRMGASAVGHSTTRAVVNSIIFIVIADGLFAAVYYTLGL